MKKNLILMLWLASIIVIAWCWWQKSENSDTENKWNNIIANDENPWIDSEDIAKDHPEWVATSLEEDNLDRIEETLPPIAYTYETRDTETDTVISSGSYRVAEGEEPVFILPEYATMAKREVIKSAIEGDMIYTLVNVTLQDDSQREVLYINEPDTLFYRAIEVRNGNQKTTYTNFVYDADLQ